MDTKSTQENEPGVDAQDPENLDTAIDGLRDVLKQDAEGLDLSSSANAGEGALDIGADLGMGLGMGLDDDLGSDFGGGMGGDLGGGMDLGAPGIGGGADSAMSDFGAGGAHVTGATGGKTRADLVLDIPIEVQVVLGTSRMQVADLMDLSEGATIGLDRKIGEPVEIMVNGKLIGRGEITVLENDNTRFGIKMIEVIGAKREVG
jgi:flagellar motor switch protein FliN/FliY